MSRLGTGKSDPPRRIVQAVVAEYAALAGLPPEIVYTKDRRVLVAWIRGKVCQRLLRDGYTTAGIGRLLGLDHTTVVSARRRVLPDVPPALGKRIPPIPNAADRVGLRVLALIESVPRIRVSEISSRLDLCEQSASDAVRRLYRQGRILACEKLGHYRPLHYTPPPVTVLVPTVRPDSFIRPPSLARLMGSR